MGKPRPTHTLTLLDSQRNDLSDILHRGEHKARTLNRARVLLWRDEGKTRQEIAELLDISAKTVTETVKCFNEGGLELALFDKPRSGRPLKLTGHRQAKLTALACSEPPEGRDRWTLVLLRDEFIQLSDLDSISHEAVRQALKKIK